jgi:hypothetical protein
LVPLAGSDESTKIKDLSGELSRDGSIEAISEFSADVPPSRRRKSARQITWVERQKISEQTKVRTAADPAELEPSSSSEFEPLEHSVYVGRQRLGRYERTGKRKYAAFDADDRLLGRFTKLANAQKAFDCLTATGASNEGLPERAEGGGDGAV